MRPHRALFHLVLRHTVWKVLLLLLLLAAAQWSAFLCLSPDPASIGLADAFSLSGGALAGLLALAFLLLSALLLLATTGWGAAVLGTPWPGSPCPRAGWSSGRGCTTPWSISCSGGCRPWSLWGSAGITAGKGASWARKPSMSPSGN